MEDFSSCHQLQSLLGLKLLRFSVIDHHFDLVGNLKGSLLSLTLLVQGEVRIVETALQGGFFKLFRRFLFAATFPSAGALLPRQPVELHLFLTQIFLGVGRRGAPSAPEE